MQQLLTGKKRLLDKNGVSLVGSGRNITWKMCFRLRKVRACQKLTYLKTEPINAFFTESYIPDTRKWLKQCIVEQIKRMAHLL